ncbi:MAG: trypsin-like serine protease [Actinomycetota bacterium]
MRSRFARLFLLALIAVGAVVVDRHASAVPAVQPGVQITMGNSLCTLNWIYDGPGGPYAGTAAHCVSGVGQRITLTDGNVAFGTVSLFREDLDYALITIDAEDVSLINPALKGHPSIPQGVSTVDTAAVGDTMQFSGYGTGFGFSNITQEQRQGILGFNDGTQHYIYGAVSPGDSGGPVADVTDGGKAFGIVNTLGLALTPLPQAGEGGLSLDALLADAAAQGVPISVRTV